MCEIRRAVERVDNPSGFGIPGIRTGFLSQDRMIRKRIFNRAYYCFFRLDIGLCNEVYVALFVYLDIAETRPNNFTRLESRFDADPFLSIQNP